MSGPTFFLVGFEFYHKLPNFKAYLSVVCFRELLAQVSNRHYLNQWQPSSQTHILVTKLPWVASLSPADALSPYGDGCPMATAIKVNFGSGNTLLLGTKPLAAPMLISQWRCSVEMMREPFPLQRRVNERDCVSNHQPHDCLLKHLFGRRSKKTSKLRVTGLCEGNSPVTGEFPAQRASNAENVSIWWRHHVTASAQATILFNESKYHVFNFDATWVD